jgi:EC042_2821-lke REase/Protein of unknown function (DUF3644)
MNYRSSYRRLVANGKAALLASIEIYNKPRIQYRDECFVILLLNAWELVIKAVLSKNGQSIFYPKRRQEPYRTLSLADAFRRAEALLPASLGIQALRFNVELLSTYRDNAVHFYNAEGFGTVIHTLAQTSIRNLRDVLKVIFDIDLSSDITWQLLPLGLDPPIDAIEYIAGRTAARKQSTAVKQFLAEIAKSTQALEAQNLDTGRLLTVFKVKLESIKKIEKADLIVGVQKAAEAGAGPLVITKTMDPNLTHPLKTSDVITAVGTLHGSKFTSGTFHAIAWKHGVKENPMYCWKASEGGFIRYSQDTVAFFKRLTAGDVDLAKKEYKERSKGAKKPVTATIAIGGEGASSGRSQDVS